MRAHRQHKIVVSMTQLGQGRQAPGTASIVHVVFRAPQGFLITSQTPTQFLQEFGSLAALRNLVIKRENQVEKALNAPIRILRSNPQYGGLSHVEQRVKRQHVLP